MRIMRFAELYGARRSKRGDAGGGGRGAEDEPADVPALDIALRGGGDGRVFGPGARRKARTGQLRTRRSRRWRRCTPGSTRAGTCGICWRPCKIRQGWPTGREPGVPALQPSLGLLEPGVPPLPGADAGARWSGRSATSASASSTAGTSSPTTILTPGCLLGSTVRPTSGSTAR